MGTELWGSKPIPTFCTVLAASEFVARQSGIKRCMTRPRNRVFARLGRAVKIGDRPRASWSSPSFAVVGILPDAEHSVLVDRATTWIKPLGCH